MLIINTGKLEATQNAVTCTDMEVESSPCPEPFYIPCEWQSNLLVKSRHAMKNHSGSLL